MSTWKNLGYVHPTHLPYDAQIEKDAADAVAAEAKVVAAAEAEVFAQAEKDKAEQVEADKIQAAANAVAILALSSPVVQNADDLVGETPALRVE